MLIALAVIFLAVCSARKNPKQNIPIIAKPSSIVIIPAQKDIDWYPQADGLRSTYFH